MEEWVSKKLCHKEEKNLIICDLFSQHLRQSSRAIKASWTLSRFSSSLQASSHESIARETYKQQFENYRFQF